MEEFPIIIKMGSLTIFEILKQIFTSWQVIAVTIALILYTSIVSHVAKSYHSPRSTKKIKIFKKKDKPAAIEEGPETAASGTDSNDELGLEEA